MRTWHRPTCWLLLISFTLQTVWSTSAHADPIFGKIARLGKETHYCGTEPVTCEDGAVEYLAENIDWLEHHIDCYGSIVAKQPDIWGEARLTKHRDEFERILYQELNQFEFKLNAAIRQSDQSFASAALALSNATSPQTTTTTNPETGVVTQVVQEGPHLMPLPTPQDLQGTEPSKPQIQLDRFAGEEKIDIEPTVYLNQLSRYVNHLHELRRINEGDDTSDSPGYALNLVRVPVSLLPGKMTREGFGAEITITAEPVLTDDLLPTTFRNLVINDLVDQMGLTLVRTVEMMPKSVALLAEIKKKEEKLALTTDAKKLLTDALNVFSEYYYFDTEEDRQECAGIIKGVLDNEVVRDLFINEFKTCLKKVRGEHLPEGDSILCKCCEDGIIEIFEDLDGFKSYNLDQDFFSTAISYLQEYDDNSQRVIEIATEFIITLSTVQYRDDYPEKESRDYPYEKTVRSNTNEPLYLESLASRSTLESIATTAIATNNNQIEELTKSIQQQTASSLTSGVSSGRSRRAAHPLPPSMAAKVYGEKCYYKLANFFCSTYHGRHVRWAGKKNCDNPKDKGESRVNLLDAQKWLQAELAAAHELLSQSQHLPIWYAFASPQSKLAETIRSEHIDSDTWGVYSVENFRNCFFQSLQYQQGYDPHHTAPQYTLPGHHSYEQNMCENALGPRSPAEALAWAIVVESALLNQRLNEDVRKIAVSRECPCLNLGDNDLVFFLPEAAAKESSGLSHEFHTATRLFQEYVKCRWPIHVFALDPQMQDQNVADFSARRRELQLALSMGFVHGEISANTLMRFSRQLETEVETISLNRTMAGFGHGNDTFGWRFYPRVQALDQPGAIGTVWQSFRGTPRDNDICHRQIEPGMRECVAVVLMPSFVPYADFDIRTNWFKLTNPRNAALTMKDTVRLSRAVTSMRRSKANCAKCAHLYRDGEIRRLLKRVDQLDRELPLQTMRSQIPYENTLGGFEMFNTGVTDLAPELVGWYGAPGIVVADSLDDRYYCGCYSDCEYCKDGEKNISCKRSTVGFSSLLQNPDGMTKAQPFPICDGEGTTLFLVGDNFSVHDTKIIAGGVCIPHVRLVSREIMRVTIPSCVNKVEVDGKEYVAIYAATPYGVTNHLHVPVYSRKLDKKTTDTIKTEVTKAVKTEVGKLKLAPRDMAIDFKKDSKIEVTATCKKDDPRDITWKIKAGTSIPVAQYELMNKNLEGEEAIFYVSTFRKGKFLGPMIQVTNTVNLKSQGHIRFEDIVDSSGKVIDTETKIIGQLTKGVALADLLDGKESAELVYYVNLKCLECKSASMQLMDRLPIEITSPCKCCETHTPPVSPGTSAEEAKPDQGKPEEVIPEAPSPEPTPVDNPTPEPTLPPPSEAKNSDGEANPVEEAPAGSGTRSSSTTVPCNCSAMIPPLTTVV